MTSLALVTGPVIGATILHPSNVGTSHWRKSQQEKHKKILRWLGIFELSFGFFCVVIGSVILGYTQDYFSPPTYLDIYSNYFYYYKLLETGEGIWCGIWIIVAGGLGIGVGHKNSTSSILNAHMALSIIAAFFACFLGLYSSLRGSSPLSDKFFNSLVLSVAVVAFASTILLVTSIIYCCLATHCCCREPANMFNDHS